MPATGRRTSRSTACSARRRTRTRTRRSSRVSEARPGNSLRAPADPADADAELAGAARLPPRGLDADLEPVWQLPQLAERVLDVTPGVVLQRHTIDEAIVEPHLDDLWHG